MDGHPNTPDIEILGDCQKKTVLRYNGQQSLKCRQSSTVLCRHFDTQTGPKLLQNSNVMEGHPRLKCDTE